mmetsp:Transcript_85120/g.214612  ORF Transcript_85120/g.214612 Transcript_85120/m.214612 type:complete len:202 (+) Transcript_85120:833-1438(+)
MGPHDSRWRTLEARMPSRAARSRAPPSPRPHKRAKAKVRARTRRTAVGVVAKAGGAAAIGKVMAARKSGLRWPRQPWLPSSSPRKMASCRTRRSPPSRTPRRHLQSSSGAAVAGTAGAAAGTKVGVPVVGAEAGAAMVAEATAVAARAARVAAKAVVAAGRVAEVVAASGVGAKDGRPISRLHLPLPLRRCWSGSSALRVR